MMLTVSQTPKDKYCMIPHGESKPSKAETESRMVISRAGGQERMSYCLIFREPLLSSGTGGSDRYTARGMAYMLMNC